jgi:hypothetical protein
MVDLQIRKMKNYVTAKRREIGRHSQFEINLLSQSGSGFAHASCAVSFFLAVVSLCKRCAGGILLQKLNKNY